MDFTLPLFYAFGAILLAAGALVVMVRNPVHAALWLVLALFTAAAIWLLLYAEFLAITLVLRYVGAVMLLLLFVGIMLDIDIDLLPQSVSRRLPLAGLGVVPRALEMVA